MKTISKRKKYFNLFADCLPVKGATRSVICDLGRAEVYFIPSDLYNILEKSCVLPVEDILKSFQININDPILEEYFSFLIENELGIWVDEILQYPRLENRWEHPSIITNAIIDVKDKNHDFERIFYELEELGCEDLQLRYFSSTPISSLDKVMRLLKYSSIKSVEILIPFENWNTNYETKLVELTKDHTRISVIYLYNAPSNRVFTHDKFVTLEGMGRIYFITENIKSCKACGIINPLSFSFENIHDFFENKNFNGCLNRKVSIDENGEIKNCPSFSFSYGNINNSSLKNIVTKKKFQKFYSITKDQIDVCKMCEFRYICTDCRAYTEDPNNLFSKPLKCGYDPIKTKWEDWTKNPLKKKGIEYYSFDLNNDKIS